MMGALHNKNAQDLRPARPRWISGLSALALSLTLAGAAAAEEPAAYAAPSPAADTPAPEAQVSMSPTAQNGATRPNSTLPSGTEHPLRPLTRAAAQQQVQEMSPMRWLSGFGPVVVGPASPAN